MYGIRGKKGDLGTLLPDDQNDGCFGNGTVNRGLAQIWKKN
jgi:hypothetical protein